MMKKILVIFGTRPEAVKMMPVIYRLKNNRREFTTKVVVTAQHREMLDQVLKLFAIEADYDLNIMKASQSLGYITTEILNKFQAILKLEKPDLVLVHGDTTTTFASALACYYEKIPVGHVEAGLRSFDRFNPYPEELNRRLTDSLCDLFFAHTVSAKNNLEKENINGKHIYVTGNTVIDALFMALKLKTAFKNKELGKIDFNKKIILVTAHRRENWGKPLENICTALKKIKQAHVGIEIVYPVHPNPNIKNAVFRVLKNIKGVHLTKPLDYIDFIKLMNKSYLVLTDSGGLQEEAPSLGKPVLVLRKVTERPEAVIARTVKIIGTDKNRIYKEVSILLCNKKAYVKMANAINPYGDGKAAIRIIKAISNYFKE